MNIHVRVRIAIAAFMAFCAAAAARGEPQDRWYSMFLMGEHAGWMHSTVTEGEATVTNATKFQMRIKRGAAELEISVETEFVETPDGVPVMMRSKTDLGNSPSETVYRFDASNKKVEVRDQSDREATVKPWPEGDWMTPQGVEAFLMSRIRSGAEEVTVRTLDPTSGLEPMVMTYKQIRPMKVEFEGRTVDGWSCLVESSSVPGVLSEEVMAPDGTLMRSTTSLGALVVVTAIASKEEATAPGGAPEMMEAFSIAPDKPIDHPRSVSRARYGISADGGTLADLPSVGAQRSTRIDAATVEVEIVTGRGEPAMDNELADSRYTEASAMLRWDDPEIAKLAAKVRGKTDTELAESARNLVYRHITAKHMGVGFASASEVCRSKQGDCTEHGVLLAALLRAKGIPSRVVTGLIYVEEFGNQQAIFGYHMWAQGLVEVDGAKQWVDFDATLPRNYDFDATHIALNVSALDDGEVFQNLSGVTQMLGRTNIKVLELEHAASRSR